MRLMHEIEMEMGNLQRSDGENVNDGGERRSNSADTVNLIHDILESEHNAWLARRFDLLGDNKIHEILLFSFLYSANRQTPKQN